MSSDSILEKSNSDEGKNNNTIKPHETVTLEKDHVANRAFTSVKINSDSTQSDFLPFRNSPKLHHEIHSSIQDTEASVNSKISEDRDDTYPQESPLIFEDNKNNVTKSKKDTRSGIYGLHIFPAKLHAILANKEWKDIIRFSDDGMSWSVIDKIQMEKQVMPVYFRHSNYASFARNIVGWGFKRVRKATYFHKFFCRDAPRICQQMSRISTLKTSTSKNHESLSNVPSHAEPWYNDGRGSYNASSTAHGYYESSIPHAYYVPKSTSHRNTPCEIPQRNKNMVPPMNYRFSFNFGSQNKDSGGLKRIERNENQNLCQPDFRSGTHNHQQYHADMHSVTVEHPSVTTNHSYLPSNILHNNRNRLQQIQSHNEPVNHFWHHLPE
uniref:HSF-type DNA-binding domain-containing protein n=1 Tax=Corethron hystrix TaxID=216773 RepID=A0A7S1FZW7_9STRA|mmetsp:Transcript_40367/g.94846  ORF Transcript_40367/g.94846 Transcript_40367/m.94846 type:complete len:381 (+) Transcript_40367:51-1193(+)